MTIDDLIQKAGGSYRIAREAETILGTQDGQRGLTPSAVRHWRDNGIPARWYGLMATMTELPIDAIHAVVSEHLGYPTLKKAS